MALLVREMKINGEEPRPEHKSSRVACQGSATCKWKTIRIPLEIQFRMNNPRAMVEKGEAEKLDRERK